MVMKENNDLKKTISIIKRNVVSLRFTITMVLIIFDMDTIIRYYTINTILRIDLKAKINIIIMII